MHTHKKRSINVSATNQKPDTEHPNRNKANRSPAEELEQNPRQIDGWMEKCLSWRYIWGSR